MENHYDSIFRRLLTLITMIFLAVAVMGCTDPIVTEMDAEHQRLVSRAERELRLGAPLSLPTSPAETFHPAP